MADSKNAVLPAATEENGGEYKRDSALLSTEKLTTKSDCEQGLISKLLLSGAENALSTAELLNITGISSARRLQEQIASERRAGAPILSLTSGGYFFPDDGEKGTSELRQFVHQMNGRAKNTAIAASPAKQELKRRCVIDTAQVHIEEVI